MGNFGFVSPLLKETTKPWDLFLKFLPERWCYCRGPLKTGEITGFLPEERVQGWGWKVPAVPQTFWKGEELTGHWRRFLDELNSKDIKVIGLDPGTSFFPPAGVCKRPDFPGVSDGKALELLFFIDRFRGILKSYEIPPQKARVLIIWEEGNLGITCARVIAREVRFLTLVSPNIRSLEIASDLILAETGLSPKIMVELPVDDQGAKIIIKCGRLSQYHFPRNSRRTVCCQLFQSFPSLTSINFPSPVTAISKAGRLPLYPALGEAILRLGFNLNSGFWHGPELPLERVVKLAFLYKELGIEITV